VRFKFRSLLPLNPFLLFPLYYSSWYVILASAIYMMMFRGVVPAWMEIFKLNLSGEASARTFSWGSAVSYVVGALLPLAIGPLLDSYALSWRWLFMATSLIGMAAVLFQLKIPISVKEILPSKQVTLLTTWN
jgi:hypothetical protein